MPTILRKTEAPISMDPPTWKTSPDAKTLKRTASAIAGPARRVTRGGR